MPIFRSSLRDYCIVAAVGIAFLVEFFGYDGKGLFFVATIGALPTCIDALVSLYRRKITIDTFNVFALGVSFATQEFRSAAFIVLMLAFARILDWHVLSRSRNAVEELLRLKPLNALLEEDGSLREVQIDAVCEGNIVVIKEGARIPVDGVIVYGSASINESSVTGESTPVQKIVGDVVVSSTLNESGLLKIKATRVGRDSTLERMAELLRQASMHKSHSEKLADRFAGIFLPFVIVLGIVTYWITHNVFMVASLFLVACADDMAVAIPLAMTASLGYAAKRGVIIKGGEWLGVLGKIKTLVLDKTGTLTYGVFAIQAVDIEKHISEERFLRLVGRAEKFSDHPVGKTIFRSALQKIGSLPDPEEVKAYKGGGVWARVDGVEVVIGNEAILEERGIVLPHGVKTKLEVSRERFGDTVVLIFFDGEFAGMIAVADEPRDEAKRSLLALREMGIRSIMFTGDNEHVASRITNALGVDSFKASLFPEDKVREVESLAKQGVVAMVGDGINDAPSLARADVGIAMGSIGTAITVEAADVVLLSDNLSHIPELVRLGKRTSSVIKGDMIIWLVTNCFGFIMVFTGIFGPTFAALYNFLTDFLPLINSARLFRDKV
ncbi:MAG: cation-translocating P-type ATPase [Parcubacteria group bacterium]|nr:cation-translocating P-type ATPase [Parcubacteria group bacterium]